MDVLLETAWRKFLNPDSHVRRESLEKLWDAWERIKTLEIPADKKSSVKQLLDKVASEPAFRATLDSEAVELTRIGNTFQIRHSETSQIPIQSEAHIDFLFHRLFAFITMLLKVTGRLN